MNKNMNKGKRRFFNLTIRKKLLLSFLLIIIIPSVTIGMLSYNNAKQELESQLVKNSSQNVALLDNFITNSLTTKFSDADYFAEKLNDQALIESEQKNTLVTLKQFALLHSDITSIYVGSQNGDLVIYPEAKLSSDFDARERDWYKDAMANQGKPVITEPYKDAATGNTLVTISQQLHDGSGVIGIDINLDAIQKMADSFKFGENGYPIIYTAGKKYLVDPNFEAGEPLEAASNYGRIMYKSKSGHISDEFKGKRYEADFVTNELTGWKVAGVMELSEVNDATRPILITTFTIVGILILLGFAIAYFIIRSITRPLSVLVGATQKVSEGDLTQTITIKNDDEIGQLGGSFNKMIASLRELIHHVGDKSGLLASSSEQLSASSEQNSKATEQVANAIQQVAVGTEQQTGMVKQTTEVVKEVAASIQHIKTNSQNVAQTSSEATGVAASGEQAIQLSIQQMNQINESVTDLGHVVNSLGERSTEISQIVDVISDIAAQTNLLALNAAIEAARAGEHGKGFAVVADEVRKLAEQSSQSTESIRQLISSIQLDTNHAVESMDRGRSETEKGIEIVNDAGTSFAKIQQFVANVASQIQEVSASIEQMAQGIEQVVDIVSEIDEIAVRTTSDTQDVSAATEEQTASMQEIAASAASLSIMAEELQEAVKTFKL
ncbi:methyl-accepting chemotaxis protein [Ferdinandcohnia quinoae]|uniref:Methyl-accepting chemotaxis protein n=1 Tax=Fredinandcohnia quinoae TaxID=2918902 RepID=A0AAW5ED86_9BACI|nr:methyl-accepting chemotaxis protein [Fredinandcohnia sp. SECRCQ15]MCH1627972.1 methyl-accepting chemotaxis protein [Fredinandcohnia sp. SECRCQ15]